MASEPQDYGRPNPEAPPELSQFAFIIGTWRCESRIKGVEGSYTTRPATWVGRYILDGYVIADEFRQRDDDGRLLQLGRNYRSYDAERGAWVMKWLDALASTWLDLGPEHLGGVRMDGSSIIFKHRVPPGPAGEPFPPETVFRISFTDISHEHFTWRAEVSTDGEASWEEVQVIEAYRVDG